MAYICHDVETTNREHLSVYHDDGRITRISACDSVYITEEIPVDEESLEIGICFDLCKSKDDDQCLVSGWASVSVNADGSIPLDWQDDIIQPDTLEKSAINFMMEYQQSGVMHSGDAVGTVVESIVFTKEKQELLGIPEGVVPQGWFITVKVHDPEVFAKVKDGTYKMFSIQGRCRRVKL